MALSGRIHFDGGFHGRLRPSGAGLAGGGPAGTDLAVGAVAYIKCEGGCLTGMALSVAAAPAVVATQLLGALLCDTVAAGISTRADEYPKELPG